MVIANLRERFVPVAIDQHIHRRLKDAEGKLFADVLKQAGRRLGGRSQGVYIFSPGGNLLAFSNTADAAHVRKLMDKALGDYQSDEEVPAPDRDNWNLVAQCPDDTLVAKVSCKVLGGYEGVGERRAEIHAASIGQDHLWIRPDEATDLTRGKFPETLSTRIVRYHLVDNTRGEPPFWRSDDIKAAEFKIDAGRIRGHVRIETPDGKRGYEADVFGWIKSDGQRLTQLDLVTHGQYHGEGTYTRGAPPGKFPFAVAIRLIEATCAADRAVPGAARGGSGGYLR